MPGYTCCETYSDRLWCYGPKTLVSFAVGYDPFHCLESLSVYEFNPSTSSIGLSDASSGSVIQLCCAAQLAVRYNTLQPFVASPATCPSIEPHSCCLAEHDRRGPNRRRAFGDRIVWIGRKPHTRGSRARACSVRMDPKQSFTEVLAAPHLLDLFLHAHKDSWPTVVLTCVCQTLQNLSSFPGFKGSALGIVCFSSLTTRSEASPGPCAGRGVSLLKDRSSWHQTVESWVCLMRRAILVMNNGFT